MATKKELQEQLDEIGAEYGAKDTVAELEAKLASAKASADAEAADGEPADEAEAETDTVAEEEGDGTSAWRVVSGFNDAHTGEYHKPGDVIEVTEGRAAEILAVAALIERA